MTAIVTIRTAPSRAFWKRVFLRCPPPVVASNIRQAFGVQYLSVECTLEKRQEIPWERLRRAASPADSALLPVGLSPGPAFDLRPPPGQPLQEHCMKVLFVQAAERRQGRENRLLLCDPDARLTSLCREVLPFGGTVSVWTEKPQEYEPLRQEALSEWGVPLVMLGRPPETGCDTMIAALSAASVPSCRSPGSFLFTASPPDHPVLFPERVFCSYLPPAPRELTAAFPQHEPEQLLRVFSRGLLYRRVFDPEGVECMTADGRCCRFSVIFPVSTENSP